MPRDESSEGSVRATIEADNCILLDSIAPQFGVKTPVALHPKSATTIVNILLGRIRAIGLPKHFFSENPWELIEDGFPVDSLEVQTFTHSPNSQQASTSTSESARSDGSSVASASQGAKRGRKPKAALSDSSGNGSQSLSAVPSVSPAPSPPTISPVSPVTTIIEPALDDSPEPDLSSETDSYDPEETALDQLSSLFG